MSSRCSFALSALLVGCCAAGSGCATAAGAGGSGRLSQSSGSSVSRASPEYPSSEDFDRRVEAHARFAAGLVYQMRGDAERALEEFTRSALADPGHEKLAVDLARRFIGRREPKRAIQVLENVVESGHAGAEVRVIMGLAHVEVGNPKRAVRAFQEAIEADPTHIAAYHGLARLYVQDNKAAEAFAILDQAAEQKIDDPRYLLGLAEQYEVIARLLGKTIAEVKPKMLALLNRALETKPRELVWRQLLADRFKALGELDQAAALYGALLEEDETRDAVRQQLIDLYLRTGKRDLARQELAGVIKQHPTNARAHYLLGSLIYETGDAESASKRFLDAIALDPDFQAAYFDLAGLYLSSGKPDEAVNLLDQAKNHFKPSFLSQFYRGMAYLQKDDYSEAIAHLVEAEVLGKASEGARLNHFFYFQLGAVHERNKQFEEAADYFKKAIALQPDYTEALNYLGYMWAERGEHLEEAKLMIEHALRLEPESPAYLDSMAWVLFQLGDSENALPPMLKALELIETPDPVLFDHLGDIYAALGRMSEASEAWRRAVELEPSDAIQLKIDQSAQEEGPGS